MKSIIPILALSLGLTAISSAQVPYQGRLTDVNGAPVAGPATIKFRLFANPTGGSALWGPKTLTTPLIDGRFAVTLGPLADSGSTNINTVVATGRYIELQVGSDAPLPRQEILATPRALSADRAASADQVQDGAPLYVNKAASRVGIRTSDPKTPLHIDSGSDASLADGSGVLLIGDQDGSNLIVDNNEIIARNNGAGTILYLGSGGTETRVYKTTLVENTVVNGSDNDGTVAALKISAGFGTMLMDGNEIDVTTGTLHLNTNSENAVVTGGSITAGGFITANGNIRATGGGLNTDQFLVSDNAFPITMRSSEANGLRSDWSVQIDTDDFLDPDIFFALNDWTQNGNVLKGTIDANGSGFVDPSDRRLKEDIRAFSGSLSKALALKPSLYKLKADPGGKSHIGFIAQDVQGVVPELVEEGNDLNGGDLLGLSYKGFGVIAIGAIQELKAEKDKEIGSLQAENESLKDRLAALEKVVASLAQQE